MTTVTEAPATRRATPQWWRALTYLAASYAYLITLWLWALVLPAVALIMFVINRNVDQVTASGMAHTHHAALWFPFSIAIILTVTYLPIHVGNGMTRRSFIKAAFAVNVGVGVANAGITTIALLVERRIYDSLGWFHGSATGTDTPVFNGGILPYALGLALLFTAGQLSGSLIGITYYRLGGIRGTLALPLTLLPLASVGLLSLDEISQWVPWGVQLGSTGGTGIAVLVLLAAAGTFHLLVRNVPIDSEDRS